MANLVLDFDGTLTEINKSSADWQKKYPMVCAEMLNVDYKDIKKEYFQIKDTMKYGPQKGFIIAGYDSLPACSDPYIESQAAIVDLVEKNKNTKFKEPENITKFLIDAYQKTQKIAKDQTYFRKGVEKFLEKAKEKYNVFIVTNSLENPTQEAMKSIGQQDIYVCGNAKKLFIDTNKGVVTFPGFPRKVLVDRKKYKKILEEIASKNTKKEETIVVGDIFELDLATPYSMGHKIIQIDNGFTPEHEKRYMEQNHHFVNSLNELEKIIL